MQYMRILHLSINQIVKRIRSDDPWSVTCGLTRGLIASSNLS